MGRAHRRARRSPRLPPWPSPPRADASSRPSAASATPGWRAGWPSWTPTSCAGCTRPSPCWSGSSAVTHDAGEGRRPHRPSARCEPATTASTSSARSSRSAAPGCRAWPSAGSCCSSPAAAPGSAWSSPASSCPCWCSARSGGVVADRVDKRRFLIVTQALAGVLALALGVLVATGTVQLWMVFALALAARHRQRLRHARPPDVRLRDGRPRPAHQRGHASTAWS